MSRGRNAKSAWSKSLVFSLALPFIAGAILASAGCSSAPEQKAVVPEPGSVPPPSGERGETIDPKFYKKVKIQ